jgi:predicted outer membrane protein
MKFRKHFVWALLALGLATVAPRFAAGDDADRFAFDKRFVKEASQWSATMNQIDRLAFDHSNSDGVKHYADKVLDGQKKLMDELRPIAERHDYHTTEELTPEQHDKLRHLSELHDTDFDVQYMSEQRDDQQAMIDLFEEARKTCVDDNLRSFADRKLPALKEFRDNADELYKKVKDKQRP